MCDPVTIGLILTAAGGGAKAVNANQALRRQDKEAAEGIRKQGLIQSGANRRVGEEIDEFTTDQGAGDRKASLEGFLDVLRSSQGDTEGALDPVLAANPRFAEQVSGGKAKIAAGGAAEAGRLSRIDAPLHQRTREGGRLGRTASDVNELARQSTMRDFLTKLHVAEQRPNEFIDLLGNVAQGVGSVMTLGAGAGAGAGSKLTNFSNEALLNSGGLVDSVARNPFFAGVA